MGGRHSTMDSTVAFHPVGPGSNLGSGDVAELIDRSTLLRVKVDCGISLIVDPSHPVLASGKLVLQKKI